MNGLRNHISIGSKPSDADQAVIWVAEEGMLLGVLEMYTKNVTIRRLLYAKEMTFKGKDGSTSVL